jgi:hypothetical protein
VRTSGTAAAKDRQDCILAGMGRKAVARDVAEGGTPPPILPGVQTGSEGSEVLVRLSEVPAPAAECWLHPGVEVRDCELDGRGLFANQPIGREEVVSRLGGRLVTSRVLHALLEHSDHYVDTITVAADAHLVLAVDSPNRYGNHSCDPNLWWVGFYALAALRDIR